MELKAREANTRTVSNMSCDVYFFFSSRRRHTRYWRDWSSDVCSSDLFQYYAGVNFSYVRSNVKENGEGYQPYPYLSAKGYPLGQVFGWEAIGYFRDEEDIKNSPVQRFSEVRPGDVKYKDLNGDKVIDKNDMKAIGHSSMLPEIYYGISLGFEYKGFGIDALFQGIGRYSVMLNTPSVYWPLRNNTNISEWYLKDKIRWTEETKDIANVPRSEERRVGKECRSRWSPYP